MGRSGPTAGSAPQERAAAAATKPELRAPDVAGVLRKNPVFGSLPDPEIRALASLARRDRVRARQWVFLEGDPAQWLCLVECGRVKIVRQARTGKEVTLELLGAGEVFGGVAVIERRPYPASAQATETSVIVKLPGHAVASVADRHPSLIREMALMIGRRLRTAHDSVTSLSADHVEARLAATLLRLAEREGGRTAQGLTLPFHLTRQALADMAGTTVETTIRMVRRWIKSGVVADAGGRLVIKDLAALRTRATGQPG